MNEEGAAGGIIGARTRSGALVFARMVEPAPNLAMGAWVSIETANGMRIARVVALPAGVPETVAARARAHWLSADEAAARLADEDETWRPGGSRTVGGLGRARPLPAWAGEADERSAFPPLPRLGDQVMTARGPGRVERVWVARQVARVTLAATGETIETPLNQTRPLMDEVAGG